MTRKESRKRPDYSGENVILESVNMRAAKKYLCFFFPLDCLLVFPICLGYDYSFSHSAYILVKFIVVWNIDLTIYIP